MCQNIDDFNRACAAIFARLYAGFPEPLLIDIRAICDQLAVEVETKEEVLGRARLISSTLRFLAAEGFFRCGEHLGAYAEDVVLTAKGLAALNRTPATLRPHEKSVGDNLVALARDLTKDGVKEGVKAAIRVALGS